MGKYRGRAEQDGARGRRTAQRSAGAPPLTAAGWLSEVMAEDRRAGARVGLLRNRPPGTRADTSAARNFHGVHFYDTDEEIVAAVVDSFEAALGVGERILLVATADHRLAIEAAMRRRRLAPDQDRYRALDAGRTLDMLLVHGEPDRQRFRALVGDLVEDLVSDRPLCIYGEMVNLLWEGGDVIAAMTLEGFWNELAAEVDFSLLCGYRRDDRRTSSVLDRICGLHSEVG